MRPHFIKEKKEKRTLKLIETVWPTSVTPELRGKGDSSVVKIAYCSWGVWFLATACNFSSRGIFIECTFVCVCM